MNKDSNSMVSIIMPSYNHEKYIKEAIDSVLSQTFQDFEIVITDDGSVDGTVDEVRKFDDPRIKLFVFDKNQGACAAAAKCIEESSGDYIAMMSSDDIFMPEKLEKQVAFLDANPNIGAVFGYAEFIDEDGGPYSGKSSYFTKNVFAAENRSRHEWLRYFFQGANCLCHPTLLIRRECYDKVGVYDKRLAQLPDLDFWIRLCMAYDIHIMQEPLIKFRLRAGNMNASASRPDTKNRNIFEGPQLLKNYFKLTNRDELLKVFPEAEKYGESFDEDMVPYLVSRVIIDDDSNERISPLRYYFALNVIYEMLGNNEKRNKLLEYYGFDYAEFIKLSGKRAFNKKRKKKKSLSRLVGKLFVKSKT